MCLPKLTAWTSHSSPLESDAMSSDLTNGNAFYFEYAIIGAHALAWLVVVAVYVLGIPLGDLARINPGLLVILLPFVYVVGLVVDYASHTLLKPLRLLIR